jgi:NAD(P)-dependent dehydrogenase (short-subunit alcohol dehydrogenase family)
MTSQTWLITGVSSGLGKALAEAVLARGYKVIGTLRLPEQVVAFEAGAPGRAFGLQVDLSHAAPLGAAVEAAVARAGGRLDVLVNNAGAGHMGALEELDEDDFRAAMEINFFGALRMIQSVVTRFREQRAGAIINISSASGFAGNAGGTAYCASKFALEGLSEALAPELAPFGVKVMIVEPGAFRTNFANDKLRLPPRRISAYAGSMAGDINDLLKAYDGAQPGDPARAADAIISAVEAADPPLRLILGEDALAWIRNKLDQAERDIEQWRAVTVSTAFA